MKTCTCLNVIILAAALLATFPIISARINSRITRDTNSCSKIYTKFSANITSPNYPNAYPESVRCCSRIILNDTKVIFLWFNSFNIEYESSCSYDYIFVLPGKAANQECNDAIVSASTPPQCGKTLPKPFSIQSNVVLIYFRSDDVRDGSNGYQLGYEGELGFESVKLFAREKLRDGSENSYLALNGTRISMVCHTLVALDEISFLWLHNDKPLPLSTSSGFNESQISILSNATASVLTINSMKSENGGIYSCKISTAIQSIQVNLSLSYQKKLPTIPLPTTLAGQTMMITPTTDTTRPTTTFRTTITPTRPKATSQHPSFCSKELREGILWTATIAGSTTTAKCVAPAQGNAYRQCLKSSSELATWGIVDTTQCRTAVFVQLDSMVKNVSLQNEEVKSEVLQELANVTVINTTKPIQAGDMMIANNILEKIARESTVVKSINQLENFLATSNNLLDNRNKEQWEAISAKEPGAAQTMQNLDLFASKFELQDEPELTLTLPNIVMTLANIPPGNLDGITFPSNSTQNQASWWTGNKIKLPAEIFSGQDSDVRVTNFIYKSLNEFLPYSQDSGNANSAIGGNTRIGINSQVLSSAIRNRSVSNLIQPIEIILNRIQETSSRNTTDECVFWEFYDNYKSTGDWSNYGCTKNFSNATTTICHCNHLTHFALLVQLTNSTPDEPTLLSLQLITYIGCGLSVISLAITLIFYIVLWRYFEGKVVIFIHFNVMLNLLISDILIITTFGLSNYFIVCVVSTFVLHITLLSSFSWMLVEGLHAYIKIVRVFSSEVKPWVYCVFAYGLSIVIAVGTLTAVIFSVGIENYIGMQACWLATNPPIILGFIIPVLVMILLNINFLILVLRGHITTVKNAPRKSTEKESNLFRIVLKDMLILLPLLGSGWILGCLLFITDSPVLQFPFAIANSLQGFFLFIFHGVRSEKVKKAWERRRAKQIKLKIDTGRKVYEPSTSQDFPKSQTKSSLAPVSESRGLFAKADKRGKSPKLTRNSVQYQSNNGEKVIVKKKVDHVSINVQG
ncbi:Adhesion G protein-coupled receptor L2 [Trichoplax sp. H2]|nr:Adhesion G protein-coupled receptor L2 [Trichoplax sp. H2]|eukprot:RDD38518.1 Adhesion G protein-coupled receptor L2 [Trichoplax sp. H2]